MATQSASPQGQHNIIVQAMGDGIHVSVGLSWLELIPWQARVRVSLRRDLDILNPEYQAVQLIGREDDLQFLRDWLGGDGIRITALVGRAGSGKTRLALELLQQVPADWNAGFLTPEEAKRFVSARNISSWSWRKPTLIVVDYAALLTTALTQWFSELADHPPAPHPLRILLLERHADAASGWYHDVAPGSWHGDAVRALFSPVEPRHIAPLDSMQQRRRVLELGLQAARQFAPESGAASVPAPGQDSWFDFRLAQAQWADPLLLLWPPSLRREAPFPRRSAFRGRISRYG